MKDPELLHVYSQDAQHDDVFIIGNRDGLASLRDKIDDVLEIDQEVLHGNVAATKKVNAMTSDGEGYNLFITMDVSPWQSDRWQQLSLPYTADWYQDRPDMIPPYKFIGIDKYKQLSRDKE